jgi:hypothetical protein
MMTYAKRNKIINALVQLHGSDVKYAIGFSTHIDTPEVTNIEYRIPYSGCKYVSVNFSDSTFPRHVIAGVSNLINSTK